MVNRSGSLLLYYRKFNYDDTFRLQTVADSLDSNCLILKSNEVYHFVYRLAGVWQASYQYEEALLLRLADQIPLRVASIGSSNWQHAPKIENRRAYQIKYILWPTVRPFSHLRFNGQSLSNTRRKSIIVLDAVYSWNSEHFERENLERSWTDWPCG